MHFSGLAATKLSDAKILRCRLLWLVRRATATAPMALGSCRKRTRVLTAGDKRRFARPFAATLSHHSNSAKVICRPIDLRNLFDVVSPNRLQGFVVYWTNIFHQNVPPRHIPIYPAIVFNLHHYFSLVLGKKPCYSRRKSSILFPD